MNTPAIVVESPGHIAVRTLGLAAPGPADVVVEARWSGVSAGTERLLFEGRMPAFPGLGYPLVPGYETVGTVVGGGAEARHLLGRPVFVPGASCYPEARGLFGATARRLVVPAARVLPLDDDGVEQVLFALAATAHHAIAGHPLPDLVVGHGVLGRLIARLAVAAGGQPVVWEVDPVRADGGRGYRVEASGQGAGFRTIVDASGAGGIVDRLIAALAPGGELVLAGFYGARIDFDFPAAFRREARIRIAAEFRPEDLAAVRALVAGGRLSLDGLVTDIAPAASAPTAYPHAFADQACLKLALDWSGA